MTSNRRMQNHCSCQSFNCSTFSICTSLCSRGGVAYYSTKQQLFKLNKGAAMNPVGLRQALELHVKKCLKIRKGRRWKNCQSFCLSPQRQALAEHRAAGCRFGSLGLGFIFIVHDSSNEISQWICDDGADVVSIFCGKTDHTDSET